MNTTRKLPAEGESRSAVEGYGIGPLAEWIMNLPRSDVAASLKRDFPVHAANKRGISANDRGLMEATA